MTTYRWTPEFRVPDALVQRAATALRNELFANSEAEIALKLDAYGALDGLARVMLEAVFGEAYESPAEVADIYGRGTTMYRLFDKKRVLLYVGITANGSRRLHEHAGTKRWFPQVHSALFEHFADRAAALIAEATAIREENPKFNVWRPDA